MAQSSLQVAEFWLALQTGLAQSEKGTISRAQVFPVEDRLPLACC